MTSMDETSLIERVLAVLRDESFLLAGTCSSRVDPVHAGALRRWLERGLHGPLAYMARHAEARADPRRIESWARGLFMVGLPYNTRRDLSAHALSRGKCWVSRYAWGRDYHGVLRARMKPAARVLQAAGLKARICVDTVPLLERHFAWKARLGFIGKNGSLIHPEFGSYLFLGAILTDMELEDATPLPEGCGDCALCMRGCPTGAFVTPRVLDAGRCLSTWTIEFRGAFPMEAPPLGGHLFGCDRCQEVCPYNRQAPLSKEADFEPSAGWSAPAPAAIAAMTEEEWDNGTRGSAIRRARYDGLVRNARRILAERD
jgi:epoxyqueuosine reductase